MANKVPIGIKFQPSDKDIIAYLLHKVNGKPLPCNDFIHIPTVDLYGEKEPWQIIALDPPNQETYYYFTRLKRTNDDVGKKQRRDIGQGKWKSCSSRLAIYDRRERVIGFVKSYVYKNWKNSEQDGKWTMKQYFLADKFKCCVKNEYVGYTFCSVEKCSKNFSDHLLQLKKSSASS